MTFAPLDEFFARSLSGDKYPTIRYQSQYTSPCTFGPIDSDCMVKWRPLPRLDFCTEDLAEFGVSQAIASPLAQMEFLSDAVNFVGSYWAGPLDCRFGYDRIVLDCGVWNDGDLQRKQLAFKDFVEDASDTDKPLIWPVAWAVADTGFFVGLNLSNGEICSAELGCPDGSSEGDRLASSLSDFLRSLKCVNGYESEAVHSF